MNVLDLFSAAAGGWSLGMHRAGFRTMAACEVIPWRRTLYSENNPGVKVYDDVRTLGAGRLLDDFGYLPSVVVGSPPCQDISSANTKGKGVEGERSGLYFEAVRIVGECRPRWFAFENSANLRTRGADRVIAALADIGYTCWPFVVGADDVGANHERKRSWLIGCDVEQVTDADCQLQYGGPEQSVNGEVAVVSGLGCDREPRNAPHPDQARRAADWEAGCAKQLGQAAGSAADRTSGESYGADAVEIGSQRQPGSNEQRQGEIAERADISAGREMGLCPPDRSGAVGSRTGWSLDDLARHIRLDDGLPAWVADTRIAVGGPKGTSAASLIVEAFGDAVLPQIPEAIGRAILRTEAALAAVFERQAA